MKDYTVTTIMKSQMFRIKEQLISRISLSCFGTEFKIRVEHDNEFENGRIFLQVTYSANCNETGEFKEWHGRKYYLSKHMTDDEIVKTAYTAFESCVKHEIMEGFKVDGVVLFNPHTDFEQLLKISHKQVKRI